MSRSVRLFLRDSRTAAAWFALQALAIVAFWATLSLVPDVRQPFADGVGGEQWLWPFAAADATIVFASGVSALAAARRLRWRWIAMLGCTASSAYPALHSLSAALAGHGAEVSAALMVPGTVLNLVFTVANRPPENRLEGRAARPASTPWNLLKTIAELAFIWSLLLWLLPTFLDRLERAAGWAPHVPDASRVAALGFGVGGTVLLVWSAMVMAWRGQGTPFPFDAPRRLVLDGPYRYVRNPQVIGGLFQGVGLVMFDWSPLLVVSLACGFCIWQLLLRPWEEAALVRRFGAAYEDYRRAVPCWLPRHEPYRSGAASVAHGRWTSMPVEPGE